MVDANGVQKQPYNDIESEWALTDPAIGREFTAELGKKLRSGEYGVQCNECQANNEWHIEEGIIKCSNCGSSSLSHLESSESLWGEFGYLTRDMRLGNLARKDYNKAVEYLDLAGDCLREGYVEAFWVALSRVAHIGELSQSLKGFFRKNRNTIRKYESTDINTQKKRNLMNKGVGE